MKWPVRLHAMGESLRGPDRLRYNEKVKMIGGVCPFTHTQTHIHGVKTPRWRQRGDNDVS